MTTLFIVLIVVGLVLLLLFRKKPSTGKAPSEKQPAAKPGADRARAEATPSKEAVKSETPPQDFDPNTEPAVVESVHPQRAAPPPPPSSQPRRSLTLSHDVDGLRKGLARSRSESGFFGKLKQLITGQEDLSPEIAEEIEEILISSDVGVQTTQRILERIRDGLSRGEMKDADRVWQALREEMLRIVDVEGASGAFELRATPTVVLLVGVNGAGKTTTIGKLATKLTGEGHRCVLAAGDTFRAAAVQQLVAWGKRVDCEVVRGKDGADPASVIFDAVQKASETQADVLLADTAGRLHTKTNLMQEMAKIARTAGKAMEGAPHEVLLVIDATNGQNALAQAKEFKEHLDLTGIVLTKLDGTAKGGMVVGIADALGLPVRFIGLGERPDDLHEFVAEDFVEALLGKEAEAAA